MAPRKSVRSSFKNQTTNVSFGFPWTKANVLGIVGGVVLLVVGYLLMSTAITDDVANNDGIWNRSNAVTYAPILLAIGYCIVVPYFIFKRSAAAPEAEPQNPQ